MNPVLEDDVFKVGALKMFRYSQPQVVIFGGRETRPYIHRHGRRPLFAEEPLAAKRENSQCSKRLFALLIWVTYLVFGHLSRC